jgi:outer membrane protein OmpA-like peptidoglycan-associated protein
MVAVALALGRRVAWVVPFVVAASASAIDVQALSAREGGAFVALPDADLGQPWTGRATITMSQARNPLVLRHGGDRFEVVGDLFTAELGISTRFGPVRGGMCMPFHTAEISGEWTRNSPGDPTVFLAAQIPTANEAERIALHMAMEGRPPGGASTWLGQSSLVLAGAYERTSGHMGALVTTGVRVQGKNDLPGAVWGSRMLYGLAGRWQSDAFGLTAEIMGSGPWLGTFFPSSNHFPLEAIGSSRLRVAPQTWLRLGFGLGLTRGITTPRWRGLLGVELDSRVPGDDDGDGLRNPVDRCRFTPEDHDGWRDRDGCPDPDDDNDGLLDVNDVCPRAAEVYNGLLDSDGCPDVITRMVVRVGSPRPDLLEWAAVGVDGGAAVTTIDGKYAATVLPGAHVLRVVAPDHHPYERLIEVPGGVPRLEVEVALEPAVWGSLTVEVRDEADLPLAATVRLPSGPAAVRSDGSTFQVRAGVTAIVVSAPGHVSRTLDVRVPARASVRTRVQLRAADVHIDGTRLALATEVAFDLDRAVVGPEAQLALEYLVEFLEHRPDIALVRVEGHADEFGGSAYNLQLSRRRARAVVEFLVAKGVSRGRLEAIGSGESHDGSRAVDFTVLVWADEAPAPLPSPHPRR